MLAVGDVYTSRVAMRLGTSTATCAESIRGGTVEKVDTTPLARKIRFRKTINGIRINTQLWFDDSGAERIPQKSIKVLHPEIDLDYFQKTAITLVTYQVSLRPWTEENPSHKSLNK